MMVNTGLACGTTVGYQLHRKLGEPTCAPCKAAHAAYLRRWRRRTDGGRNPIRKSTVVKRGRRA